MSFPWKRCLCSGVEVNVKCVRAASALNDGFREASSDERKRSCVFRLGSGSHLQPPLLSLYLC